MALGTEAWYPATEPGTIEVKQIPAAKLMIAGNESMAGDDGLFGRLFRYISKHDVKMTVPVETQLQRGEMRFYVGTRDAPRALRDDGGVRITEMPARMVASIGARGSYSGSNIREAEEQLASWLARNPQYQRLDEPYAVFWNGPYVPGVLKRFEVHVPVRRVLN